MQLGEAIEGSRVTLVSDSALSDYEAFRRGDRFYVRIPLADFTTAPPRFRANGFEDVQIQKVGDGLVISFKLLPGASARVDLRGNRLDVIFSSPNRSSYLASRTGTSGRVENPQTANSRDTSGPVPPVSTQGPRDRVISETSDGTDTRGSQDPWAINPGNSGRTSRRTRASETPGNAEVPSATPISPVASSTPVTSSTHPAVAYASSPAPASAATASRSGSFSNLRRRSMNWVSANRLASLLGALILLALILFVVMALRNRREGVAKAKRAKVPKVQPRYSEGNELSSELTSELSSASASSADEPVLVPKSEPVAQVANVSSEPAANRNVPPRKQAPQTASVPATAAANGRSQWVSKPVIASSAVAVEASSDEEEREVFEL